jgi:protein SCO1
MIRIAVTLLLTIAATSRALAHDPSTFLDQVGFDQQPGAALPLTGELRDASGAKVHLGDYFDRVPVVLVLAYFDCDNLCGVVLQSTMDTLRHVTLDAGKDFQVVVVDIDPTETPALARSARSRYLERYGRPDSVHGWHFLTARRDVSRSIAHAIGFRYVYDPHEKRYAHPAGITILTPQGRVSRYLFGVRFAPRDLRLALVEASRGSIGSVTDQLLLLCYHYDPSRGKYGFLIMDFLRAAGAATVAAVGLVVFVLGRRSGNEHRRRGRPS